MGISTHTPHTGCDVTGNTFPVKEELFQLTHPTRGATEEMQEFIEDYEFQLTHPTRGATRCFLQSQELNQFQLTHPTRGATLVCWLSDLYPYFNSHTPHGVRPSIFDARQLKSANFNSHTPHGVRRKMQ